MIGDRHTAQMLVAMTEEAEHGQRFEKVIRESLSMIESDIKRISLESDAATAVQKLHAKADGRPTRYMPEYD
jgi:hypothetical protein